MNIGTFHLVESHKILFLSLFYAIYILMSILHLLFAFFEKEKERKVTKPFLLFILATMAFILLPFQPFLYLGCFFALIGDICFIFKDKKKFIYLGMAAFFLNHLFFILELSLILSFKNQWNLASILIYSILFSIILFASYFGIRKILRIEKMMSFCGCIYFTSLALDLGMTILLLINQHFNILFSLCGMILFLISDSILSYTMFLKDIKRRDFYIMFTYLSAQGLFLFGTIQTLYSL